MKIGSGKDYKHLSEGDIPVFGTGGCMTFVNEYLMDGESVFIGRKGTINKPSYYSGKFWTVDTLFYTHSFDKIIPKFAFYCFEKINWLKYNEASGVPSLSKSTIEQIEIQIPAIDEQVAITDLLTLIDDRINRSIKIIEGLKHLKSASCKQIFTQELRFKDDNGEEFVNWREVTLGNIADRITSKNQFNNKNVLTISAQHGLISQLEFFNKSVSAKDLTGYYILKKNDFAYNKSYSSGYPMGAIKRLKHYSEGVVSTLYVCFRFGTEVSLSFMEQYFEAGIQNIEIEKVAQEGARNHGLLNIGINDFFNISLILPSYPEQIKIADFLSGIDEKIALETSLLEQLKTQKQYLLQQMFI
jgi:type I restriction enzyme S subunit